MTPNVSIDGGWVVPILFAIVLIVSIITFMMRFRQRRRQSSDRADAEPVEEPEQKPKEDPPKPPAKADHKPPNYAWFGHTWRLILTILVIVLVVWLLVSGWGAVIVASAFIWIAAFFLSFIQGFAANPPFEYKQKRVEIPVIASSPSPSPIVREKSVPQNRVLACDIWPVWERGDRTRTRHIVPEDFDKDGEPDLINVQCSDDRRRPSQHIAEKDFKKYTCPGTSTRWFRVQAANPVPCMVKLSFWFE